MYAGAQFKDAVLFAAVLVRHDLCGPVPHFALQPKLVLLAALHPCLNAAHAHAPLCSSS